MRRFAKTELKLKGS